MAKPATALLGLLLLLAPAAAGDRTVRVGTTEELRAALAAAKPGTEILVAPGKYEGGLYVENLRGEPKLPILLAGADPDDPPVIEGGTSGLHVAGGEHFRIRDMVFAGATGNGLNIDDGGTFETPARRFEILGVTVRDVGPEGNCDGIKLSGAEDFVVRDCTLLRWGAGGSGIDMVGCHRGVIRNSTFAHEDGKGSSGVQAKGGSSEIAIARCRFKNAGQRSVNLGGSTGRPYFRPPDPGYEAKKILVMDCVFIGSTAPIAFVGVDGATVERNTIYRPGKWILRILQESRGEDFVPCRNGTFDRNLIVFRAADVKTIVNVGEGTSPETFSFGRNFWYCEDEPARSRPDLPVEESNGVYGKDPLLTDPAAGDFRPREGSPATEYGARTR